MTWSGLLATDAVPLAANREVNAMNCYIHHDQTAVAICAYCGKGMCDTCAVESNAGARLVCSDHCADKIRMIDEALGTIANKTLRSYLITSWVCALSGLAFFITGVILAISVPSDEFYFPLFVMALGVIFVLGAYWYHRVSRRTRRQIVKGSA